MSGLPTTTDHKSCDTKRAAQYVRMSTEHQRYSTRNQEAAIQSYADKHGFTVIRTYRDKGKSGLRISGRSTPTECTLLWKAAKLMTRGMRLCEGTMQLQSS